MPFVLLVLIGLTHLAQAIAGGPAVDPDRLFHRFFPPHTSEPGQDPFALVERLLVGVITENRGQISLYAAPGFIWFSTRLFAGVRTSLNDIYDVSARPRPAAQLPAQLARREAAGHRAWSSRRSCSSSPTRR